MCYFQRGSGMAIFFLELIFDLFWQECPRLTKYLVGDRPVFGLTNMLQLRNIGQPTLLMFDTEDDGCVKSPLSVKQG